MRTINKTPQGRAGFSLIELLIVIVVIAILASFLLGAVQSARIAARETAVIQDIKAFEKAIADFKGQFGVEPPSFIVLYEQGTTHLTLSWKDDASAPWRDGARRNSRALIREMWPQYDFSQDVDINCDGDKTDILILNGAECLAFFIGGMHEYKDLDGDGTYSDFQGARGFSSNPAIPFGGFSTNPATPSFAGNRIGPFLEMTPDRLVDIDGDRIHEYLDSFPGQSKPIQYLSSYGGQGYRPGGNDATTTDDDEAVVLLPSTPTLQSVYMQAAGTATQPGVPYKENGFQLISPGFDGDYGTGGFCDPTAGCVSAASDPAGRTPDVLAREKDNITNFKGRLN